MINSLTEHAKMLADRVGALALAVDHLDQRTNRSERVQLFVVFGLLLDLVLSVAVAFVVANQFASAASLRETIEHETVTRQQGVCPIYALFIGSYNPESRAEGPDRDAYNQAFKTINEAYSTLKCTQQPVPPGKPR